MSGGTRSGTTPTPPQVSDDSSEVSYRTLVTNHHPFTHLYLPYHPVIGCADILFTYWALHLTCHKVFIRLSCGCVHSSYLMSVCCIRSLSRLYLDQRAQPLARPTGRTWHLSWSDQVSWPRGQVILKAVAGRCSLVHLQYIEVHFC